MEFEGKEFDSIDYFGCRCCVCDSETNNEPRHNVFTSKYFSKLEKTGFKEWTTTSRMWDFKYHPCRACDKCEQKKFIRAGVVLSLTAVATAYYYIAQWSEIIQKATWEQYAPGVIGFIAAALILGQIYNRFGIEAIAKKKAASIRAAGYVGYASYEFSDVAKSIGS